MRDLVAAVVVEVGVVVSLAREMNVRLEGVADGCGCGGMTVVVVVAATLALAVAMVP